MLLIVDSWGSWLSVKGNRVVVKHKREKIKEFSLEKVKGVILGSGVGVSTDTLIRLCEKGIPVTMDRECFVASYKMYDRPEVRKRQMMVEKRPVAWALVRNKVANQQAHLHYIGLDPGEVVEAESPFAYEAHFARHYWKELGKKLEGFRRNQRGVDLYNSMLNYGYGILKHYALNAVLLRGLDPYFAFLHGERDYRPSLVFDLMEPFRPVVDNVMLHYLLVELEGQEEVEFDMIKGEYAKAVVKRLTKEKIVQVGKREFTVVGGLGALAGDIVRYVLDPRKGLGSYLITNWLVA